MRGVPRLVVGLVCLLAAALVAPVPWAGAADPFAHVGDGPTQGTPVAGGYLTADPGTWTSEPDSREYQWLRDGAPVAGATSRDYLVQPADVGHQLAPRVTAHYGSETASFTGTAVTVRRLTATLTLDVRRVHPAPGKQRLVWTAVSFLTTERPAGTDGGTVTAYEREDGELRPLGAGTVTRGAAFVRLPWKRAPLGRTKVVVCFAGNDVVADACSPYDVVRGGR